MCELLLILVVSDLLTPLRIILWMNKAFLQAITYYKVEVSQVPGQHREK